MILVILVILVIPVILVILVIPVILLILLLPVILVMPVILLILVILGQNLRSSIQMMFAFTFSSPCSFHRQGLLSA